MRDTTFGFSIPFGAAAAAVFFVVMLALFVVAVRRTRGKPRRARFLALRALTLVCAFLVATQPSCSREETQRVPGRLAILIDGSRSMGVGREGERRWDRVQALLRTWRADPTLERAAVSIVGSSVEPSDVEALTGAQPTGEESRLLDSLRQLVSEDAREELGAVVLVSDGADTTRTTVESLDLAGVRVHTVAVADETADRDDAIVGARADARAYLRTPYRVSARLRAAALAGESVPVTLQRGGRTLETRSVSLDDRGEAEVTFEVMPERIGRVFHRIVIPVDPTDVVPENNTRSLLVRVGRERLRVLLVAGHPTWDVRFLRAFLERDPTNDLISFFILRTETDMLMADSSEMSLIPFPTDELFREHLASFDLVVFQDFDFGPYRMETYLPLIERYVAEGGSFAMVGGDKSFASGGYLGTAIERLLPVELPVVAGSGAVSLDPFRPELVSATELHPIVALTASREENRALFGRLAESFGTNVVRRAREAAVPLLVHPTLRAEDGAPMPVLTVGEHRKGRVFALTIDSSHRWGLATAGETGDASVYERFWDRAVRWLARDPGLEPAQILTDRERYGLGADIAAELLARRPTYEPMTGERVRVTVLDEAGATVQRQEVTVDGEGRARLVLDGPERIGVYRILMQRAESEAPLAEEAFVVEASGDELADPRPRPELLRLLSERTRGVHARSVAEAPSLRELDVTRERSLGLVTKAPFRTPWFIGFTVLAFGLEWILRRRSGER